MWCVKQTVTHDPDNGKVGNCFSASLASLLHMPIESIPLFTGEDWAKQVNDFLRPYGIGYMLISGSKDALEQNNIKGLYHEVEVPSLHPQAEAHSCVAIDGEVVFDPGPITRESYEIRSFGIFVLLKPWTHLDGSWKTKK